MAEKTARKSFHRVSRKLTAKQHTAFKKNLGEVSENPEFVVYRLNLIPVRLSDNLGSEISTERFADENRFEVDREDAISQALGTLKPMEASVLRMRFGLDGNEAKTCASIAKEFNVTGFYISRIEEKALRKLRHPSRSDILRPFSRQRKA